MHLHVPCIEKCGGVLLKKKKKKKLANVFFSCRKIKRDKRETKKKGKHDEEINMQKTQSRRQEKGTLISYQNTGSNLAALFMQTMSASNYPMQATN